MGTNVYLSAQAPGPIDLALSFGGPSDAYNAAYSLLTSQVPGNAKESKVLSIDRGGGFNPGMVQSTTELTLTWDGHFLGSLVVLLSNLQEPVKNSIEWSLRGPDGAALIDFASDYATYETSFETPEASIRLTVRGVGTVWFDDVAVGIQVTPRHVERLVTARDPTQSISLAAFVDDLGRSWRKDLSADGQWSQRRLVSTPPKERTIDLAIALSFGQKREPLVFGVTREATLWWRDSKVGGQLPLKAPDGTPVALSVSDVQFGDGAEHVDVILTTKSNGAARLYRRVLKLSPSVGFDGGWADWRATTERGAVYVPATADRFVLEIAPALLGALKVYSCTANAGSERWGGWTATFDLPDGVEPLYLAGTPWFENGVLPNRWAAIVTAHDGRIYLTSTDATRGPQAWDRSPFAGTTIPATTGLGVAVSGYAIVLAVAGGTIRVGRAIVKENTLSWWDSKVQADGIRLIAPFVDNGSPGALAAGARGLDLRVISFDSRASRWESDPAP